MFIFDAFVDDISYNVMSPTNLKAFLNSNRIDLLGAMVYPFSDKKGFRLALDLLLLLVAYDDPFDEDVLMLDENVATKVTNDFVSAITEAAEAETFQLVPNLPPIIMSFQEYVFSFKSQASSLWSNKRDMPFWRKGFAVLTT